MRRGILLLSRADGLSALAAPAILRAQGRRPKAFTFDKAFGVTTGAHPEVPTS